MWQIDNPATGLWIFNTDSLDFYFFTGSYWLAVMDQNDTIPEDWSCGYQVEFEGQTYNTVEIGTQCWFAENLNRGTRINGSEDQTNNDTIEKYCYNNELVVLVPYSLKLPVRSPKLYFLQLQTGNFKLVTSN